ncbi:leucine rich repeat LRR-containing protein [Nitzschia inconspicua]|uniref:Leucine rich repeat LRR-containing protein n=1 Tax=Nitzschia inconspicua TaxID=303405 RepID=A0A9K3PPD4_9STRA|nr:leucine rich repeat LRR-containing protein [Nitzschia inconspicua]
MLEEFFSAFWKDIFHHCRHGNTDDVDEEDHDGGDNTLSGPFYITRNHNNDAIPRRNNKNQKSTRKCDKQRCMSAPLHPFQSFSHLCDRIERDDPNLTLVEFRDEFLNVRRLARALANNHHIVEFNLIQSIRDRETRDSRPRSAPTHDLLHLCLDGLQHNTAIEKLDLTETTIRASGAAFVSQGLLHHPQLQQLRLGRCLLQDEGLRRLAAAPLGIRLEELDLCGNNLSDGTALLQLLQQNPHLKKLDLSNNAFTNKGLEQFLSCGGFRALQVCDLSCNNIRRGVALSLGKALADPACQLKELYLDANEMINCSVESIALGLASNVSLEKLSLNGNDLCDVSAVKIAAAMRTNPNIRVRELLMSGNKIRNTGANAIMKHACESMTKLDLSRNQICDGRIICRILRSENTTMRKLSLSRNPIPLQEAHEVELWTLLNNSGGRQLLSIAGEKQNGGDSMAVWPKILGRVSSYPNGVYYFLTRKPELFQAASSMEVIGSESCS